MIKPVWRPGMTRNEWLFSATLDMPSGVKERVRAETLAHLEDAGALQAADVRGVLGSPQQVNRELRRLYLTADEYCRLVTEPAKKGTAGLDVFSLLAWPGLAVWFLFDSHAPLHGQWPFLLTFVVCSAAMLWLTQALPVSRRRLWRNLASNVAFSMMYLTLPEVVNTFSYMGIVLLGLLLYRLAHDFWLDVRLQRTLKLEGMDSGVTL